MTAPALRSRSKPRLVVVSNRQRRPRISGLVSFSLLVVLAFLGMIMVRTSLDRSTIDLAQIERSLTEARSLNQRLRLEVARLESPDRIAPLAQELGMVYPATSERLVVDGVRQLTLTDPRWSELNRFASDQLGSARILGSPQGDESMDPRSTGEAG